MDTIQVTFEQVSRTVFSNLFSVGVKAEKITGISLENILYSKKLNVSYGYSQGQVHVIFGTDALDTFKEHAEEPMQKLYASMNIEMLFSNIFGILIYNMFDKIRDLYSTIDFTLPEHVSHEKIHNQKTLLVLYDKNKKIGFLGFTFTQT